MSAPVTPHFDPDNHVFVADDGARLGLTVWPAKGGETPEIVVVGVHGMNDYANAFHMAAPYWAENGVTTYAYDQRGFGRSPGRGIWPEEELMREDLRTAVKVARARHPGAVITVVGISMGGSVALSAFGSDRPPAADRLIASGPGLRGWGAMNPLYKASLWASTRTRPGWIVRPPRRLVKIEPSDNVEMLQRTWSDPLMMPFNRIDQVYGVVSLMETAHMAGRATADRLADLAVIWRKRPRDTAGRRETDGEKPAGGCSHRVLSERLSHALARPAGRNGSGPTILRS